MFVQSILGIVNQSHFLRENKMIEFKKISEFPKGTLYNQLVDAYSFNDECKKVWDTSCKEYDNYFYNNLDIADISWNPRHKPDYVEIGHNCIITKYKGKGYGHIQLEEAIRRIKKYDKLKKIVVTTNEPAQKNYESEGFVKVCERENKETQFFGKYIDYEIKLK